MTYFKLLKYLDKILRCVPFTSRIIHLAILATVFTIYNFYSLKTVLLRVIHKNVK